MPHSILTLRVPCRGWLGPLAEVPDPAFAGAMMGDGMMIDLLAGEIVAPCNGDVIAVAPTGHSVTLRLANGAELLIHVGIDTVALNGAGFTAQVSSGAHVATGQPLLRCDLDAIVRSGRSLRTPIVVINDGFIIETRAAAGLVEAGAPLFSIAALGAATDTPLANAPEAKASVMLPLPHGLHARPSARLAAVVRGWAGRATVECHGRSANAASVAALMALGAAHGDELTIATAGPDAEAMVATLVAAVAEGLGEQPAPAPSAPEGRCPHVIAPVALDGSAVLTGVRAAGGVVIGQVLQLCVPDGEFERTSRGEDEERAALSEARTLAAARLDNLAGAADETRAGILAAHRALLDDPDLIERAEEEIRRGASAPQAWRTACRAIADALARLNNSRLRERGDDLLDIERQVLALLSGTVHDDGPLPPSTIVIAETLVPTELLALAARGVAGICTVGGGATSHVAILAAGMGLPALAAVDPAVRTIPDGTAAILDGDRGRMHVAPSETMRKTLAAHLAARRGHAARAAAEASAPAVTTDGTRILVLANLGDAAGAHAAMAKGADGCGLLRSEFLYLDRAGPPDEAEQRSAYQAIADAMPGAPLVIRTLDIGGDKPVPFLPIAPEENPALGLRGVRLSLRHPDLFRRQLRAILGVAGPADVQLMLPMVNDRAEFHAARAMFEEERASLGCGTAQLGVMIETPAAALLTDTLARSADFFSIGTNDLTQYALAIDRGSVPLAHQLDGLHPAVLRLIETCSRSAIAAGTPVGVCGALAGDPLALPILIGLGVSRLSVSAGRIAAVKAAVRTVRLDDCRTFASQACMLASPGEVRDAVRAAWPGLENWS